MPVENMPVVLQYLVYANPVYHMNQILVRVWFGTPQQIINLIALAIWVAVCLVLIQFQKGFASDK